MSPVTPVRLQLPESSSHRSILALSSFPEPCFFQLGFFAAYFVYKSMRSFRSFHQQALGGYSGAPSWPESYALTPQLSINAALKVFFHAF